MPRVQNDGGVLSAHTSQVVTLLLVPTRPNPLEIVNEWGWPGVCFEDLELEARKSSHGALCQCLGYYGSGKSFYGSIAG